MSRSLPVWSDRQPDYANLFNPAFVGILLRAICRSYSEQESAGGGMPFALCFVATALVLHPSVQRNRPRTIRTRVEDWLQDNLALKAEIAAATAALTPIVREALVTMIRSGLITIEKAQLHSTGGALLDHAAKQAKDDSLGIEPHLIHAKFVGRWLAASGGVATIFGAVGVRP